MTGSEKWGDWVWCLSTMWLMGDGSCVMVCLWLWDGLWVLGVLRRDSSLLHQLPSSWRFSPDAAISVLAAKDATSGAVLSPNDATTGVMFNAGCRREGCRIRRCYRETNVRAVEMNE